MSTSIAEQLLQFQQSLEVTIEKQIAESIEKNVNGKIRNLDKKIDDYIAIDTAWKKEDENWKKTAQPTVDLGTNAIGFWKVLKWITVAVVSVAAAIKIFFK